MMRLSPRQEGYLLAAAEATPKRYSSFNRTEIAAKLDMSNDEANTIAYSLSRTDMLQLTMPDTASITPLGWSWIDEHRDKKKRGAEAERERKIDSVILAMYDHSIRGRGHTPPSAEYLMRAGCSKEEAEELDKEIEKRGLTYPAPMGMARLTVNGVSRGRDLKIKVDPDSMEAWQAKGYAMKPSALSPPPPPDPKDRPSQPAIIKIIERLLPSKSGPAEEYKPGRFYHWTNHALVVGVLLLVLTLLLNRSCNPSNNGPATAPSTTK